LDYAIHNDADDPINMRIKVVSIENTDGSSVELCLGKCYYSVAEGQTYPSPNYNDGKVTVAPGGQTADGNHFWNNHESENGAPITYVLQFQQMDPSGLFPVETIEFTYKYIPDMGVDTQIKDFDVQILRNIIKNGQLDIKNQQPVDVQIYNLLGKLVKSAHLDNGMNTVNISNLSSQIYLVRFHNTKGQTKTQKIVVE